MVSVVTIFTSRASDSAASRSESCAMTLASKAISWRSSPITSIPPFFADTFTCPLIRGSVARRNSQTRSWWPGSQVLLLVLPSSRPRHTRKSGGERGLRRTERVRQETSDDECAHRYLRGASYEGIRRGKLLGSRKGEGLGRGGGVCAWFGGVDADAHSVQLTPGFLGFGSLRIALHQGAQFTDAGVFLTHFNQGLPLA